MLIIFLMSAASFAESPSFPVASKGVLDLRNWDFGSEGTVGLTGQWGFHWQRLLSPGELDGEQSNATFAKVPGTWQSYSGSSDARGYATFYLTVVPPSEPQVYGLFIKGGVSAYRLWVDGEEMAHIGQVGRDEVSTNTDKKPVSVFFSNAGEPIDIIVQIASFDHRKTGFRDEIIFGLAEDLHRQQSMTSLLQAVCVSILFTLSLYHFFIFAFRKENIHSFYFAVYCLLVAIRYGITGSNTLLPFIPDFGWPFILKTEYITLYFLLPTFMAMMKSLYPKDIHTWFVRLITVIAIVFSVFTVFSSTYTASYSIPYYQVVMMVEMLYGIYFLIRIFKYRREGRGYVGFAILVGTLGAVSEISYFTNFVDFGSLGDIGILGYIFIQAISLASRSSNAFYLVENLSQKLNDSNFSLQHSERQYRAIFEDSLDTIFVTESDGTFENISPACFKLVGYTPEEIVGMTDLSLLVSETDIREIGKRASAEGSLTDFELTLQHKDGRELRVLVNTTARKTSDGKFNGVQGFVHDITDRIQAREQRQRAERFEQIASVDPLTDAYTRRYFYESGEREMARTIRNSTVLSLVILDIDFFKRVNDDYGHLAGDKVLVELVKFCTGNLRATDVFCRFGGEEFIILMPETGVDLAFQKAEQLRKLLTAKPLTVYEQQEITVSFSAGVASWQAGMTIDALIAAADKALYRAKDAGRNRCLVSVE